MAAALALLGDVVENQLRRALALVLEHESDVVEAATYVWIVEEYVSPELGKLLRRVAVPVAQAEIPDDYGPVIVIYAYPQGSADLVPDHVAF